MAFSKDSFSQESFSVTSWLFDLVDAVVNAGMWIIQKRRFRR